MTDLIVAIALLVGAFVILRFILRVVLRAITSTNWTDFGSKVLVSLVAGIVGGLGVAAATGSEPVVMGGLGVGLAIGSAYLSS